MGHNKICTTKDHALCKLIQFLHGREHAHWHMWISARNQKHLDPNVTLFKLQKIEDTNTTSQNEVNGSNVKDYSKTKKMRSK